jgi:hypothetical protein
MFPLGCIMEGAKNRSIVARSQVKGKSKRRAAVTRFGSQFFCGTTILAVSFDRSTGEDARATCQTQSLPGGVQSKEYSLPPGMVNPLESPAFAAAEPAVFGTRGPESDVRRHLSIAQSSARPRIVLQYRRLYAAIGT